MGSKDPNFLGKLKIAWDIYFKNNPKLILAICGSMSAWIEDNILSSTAFLGRESLTLTLRELPLEICKEFWTSKGVAVQAYEMLRVLGITGGIPRYLEEIDPRSSAEENIRQLCFLEGGILFNEFEKIFSDLFTTKNELYREIVSLLADAMHTQSEIASMMNYKSQSEISAHLDVLEKSGFISRDYTWNIASGKDSNMSQYRLSDNYSRFYLKYILPNKQKIIRGDFHFKSISNLPAWSSIMGLQIENLVLNNRNKIKALLNIPPEEVVSDNPFFQKKTKKNPGCQIDYLIQTKFNTLYVCEIKFSRTPIGMKILEEMREKIKRFVFPKQFSIRPVLIHVNGVTDEVLDSHYFSHILDMSQLF